MLCDVVEQRVDHRPCSLDFIASREQRRIAEQYVEQKCLISRGRISAKCLVVRKIHVHRRYLEFWRELVCGSRRLYVEAQGNSFVGLHSHHQHARPFFFELRLVEEENRRGSKLNHYLRHAIRQPLSRSQIEGNVSPSPVVYLELDCSECRRDGVGGDVLLLAIPGHTEGSIAVHLPEHGVLFTGDTIANVGSVMLGVFNLDRARTVASLQRLAALDVQTACFGHGDPIDTAAGDRIREVAVRLTP